MTFIVGLTGGIGCGKSTIEKMFVNETDGNVLIIDTDVITHELQQPGKAGFVFIKQAFGDIVVNFDGSLNRDYLRNLVFSNKAEKAKLEAIMTPLIYHVVIERIAAERAKDRNYDTDVADYIILTVPMLVESKLFSKLVDRILVIDCPEDVQVERVMKRSNLRKSEVERILAAQSPRVFRIMKADDIIQNYNCDPKDNLEVVLQLHEHYLELAIQAMTA